MDRPRFDAATPDMALVRQVFIQRLKSETDWEHLDRDGRGFLKYVELEPPRPNALEVLAFRAYEVFWSLVVEGVLAPGKDSLNEKLPWFHVTDYGRRVLQSHEYVPHDRSGYLARLHSRIPAADPTVAAYLAESLETFVRGNLVASAVMLGVAAERVFDLLCDSLAAALRDPNEKAAFDRLLDGFNMRRKNDWVHAKLLALQGTRPYPSGLPENPALTLTVVYDLLRTQRNELGHPRELPPRVDRADVQSSLEIFPRYYERAEQLRQFLLANRV